MISLKVAFPTGKVELPETQQLESKKRWFGSMVSPFPREYVQVLNAGFRRYTLQ